MPIAERYVIGLGTNDKFVSRLIRVATNGWCSHTWLEYSSIRFGGLWVIHATDTGVVRERIMDIWRRYPTRKRYEVRWDLTEGMRQAVEALGTPYDYGSTLTNALLLVLNRYTSYAPPDIARNPKLFNCSEFVAMILKASGIPGHGQIDPEATSPIKLDSICLDGAPEIIAL